MPWTTRSPPTNCWPGLRTDAGIANYRSFVEEAADLVVSYGGSLSGEHGDGQSRGELLPRMYGPELMRAFGELKAFDPGNRMNPGKVVEPYRLDQNLTLRGWFPREPKTLFHYPEDGGKFTHAASRCVGIGKCRGDEGGVMCPSYRVTREEEHLWPDTFSNNFHPEVAQAAVAVLDVSVACAEHGLWPAVRDASPDTAVLADGFSCRTQIEVGHLGRTGIHLAQLLAGMLPDQADGA